MQYVIALTVYNGLLEFKRTFICETLADRERLCSVARANGWAIDRIEDIKTVTADSAIQECLALAHSTRYMR